jgi:3-deoxy-D-manno-octulosonic-acid transferase
MWILYDLIIHLYGYAISIAALFNAKARAWVDGRKGLLARIESAVVSLQSSVSGQQSEVNSQKSEISNRKSLIKNRLTTEDYRLTTLAWFHCASLGEFEQGRPVIEAFRKEHPDWKILLTFFSPSGYEIRKNYEGADYIFYLPLDTARNARKFINLVRPSVAVFVKYEFWFRYLDVLYKNKIPVYVISAIFRPDQHFFRWYGGWARKQLRKVSRFFVQDQASKELLRAKGIERVIVSGDTRFDRVASVADKAKPFPLVEKFAGSQAVFLAGSTWPADEQLIINLINAYGDRMKFIIAPHEVDGARISALKSSVISRQSSVISQQSPVQLKHSKLSTPNSAPSTQHSALKAVLFSELTEENAQNSQVLIVNGIGYLSHLYQYATIAYIGGGFGAGIHNILEAAAFGKPVIFGPKYEKFKEANDLIDAGGAFSIVNSEQLNNRSIELLEDKRLYLKSSEICSSYIRQKKGATEIILTKIFEQKI